MAIIYSYPYVSTVNNSDTLVISVSDTTADNGFLTKSLTADNLASYVTARVNLNFLGDTGTGVINLDTQNLTISGTSNEIETSASSQALQIGLPDNVTITNNLTIGGDFTGGRGTFVGDLSVGDDLTVGGLTDTSTLQVNSTASIGGDTSIGGSLSVTNTLTVQDNQGNGSIIDSLLNMSANRIINVSNPINSQDAATKLYVDGLISGGLSFKGSFRADTGEILSGANTGSYLYNCPGGAGTRVPVITGDYYIVANTGGQFYCSGDLLNIGDSIMAVADAAADSSTVSDWATLESDNIEGSGTANKIPLWADSQVLSDSIITQVGTSSVTISGNINGQGVIEGESLTIHTGPSTITGELDKDGSKITNLADPTAGQDAATKAYVDASGVNGTGTTTYLPVWSDGPNGILSNSSINQVLDGGGNVREINIITNSGQSSDFKIQGHSSKVSFGPTGNDIFLLSGDNTGFYTKNFQMRGTLAVGRPQQSTAVTLDVGNSTDTRPAAWFRNGVVISNNPAGVQVDNTSMVIGAGNNDNISGSDHCLIVGSGNQITSNSDQSVAFGQGNAITNSTDAFAVGNSNAVTNSQRTLVLGYSNDVSSASSFVAGGDNTVGVGGTNIILGYSNQSNGGNSFTIGNVITSNQGEMVLGYRNYTAGYPTPDKNLGLGDTKFVVAVGSSNNNTSRNAIIITEGGINGGNTGTVPQIPRVILPTVPTFSASNDAAADAIGVPEGALYQNNGVVQINRGGGSTTDPLAGGGATQTTGTITPTVSAGISGISYTTRTGYWTRIDDVVSVFVDVNIGAFTKTNPSQVLRLADVFPYDIDNNRFFFNSDIMSYTNISDGGTAIPAIYVLKPNAIGTDNHTVFFGQSTNFSLGFSNIIDTDNMSTGGFNINLSFTYKATGSTLRTGATLDP